MLGVLVKKHTYGMAFYVYHNSKGVGYSKRHLLMSDVVIITALHDFI